MKHNMIGIAIAGSLVLSPGVASAQSEDAQFVKDFVAGAVGHPVSVVVEALGSPTQRRGSRYLWIVNKKTLDDRPMFEKGDGLKCTIEMRVKDGIVQKSTSKGNHDGCFYLVMRNAPTPT